MRYFATEHDAREYTHVVEVADFAAQDPTGGHSWVALMAGAAVPTLRCQRMVEMCLHTKFLKLSLTKLERLALRVLYDA